MWHPLPEVLLLWSPSLCVCEVLLLWSPSLCVCVCVWSPSAMVSITVCVCVWSPPAVVSITVCVCVCEVHPLWSPLLCVCVCEVLLLWSLHHRVCVWVAQSCPTLSDPTNCSPPSSSVHGLLPARILTWLPCPSPENLPDPGVAAWPPAPQARFTVRAAGGPPALPQTHQHALDASLTCHALAFLPLFFSLLHIQQLAWGWLVLNSFFLNGKSQVPIYDKPFYCLGSNLII